VGDDSSLPLERLATKVFGSYPGGVRFLLQTSADGACALVVLGCRNGNIDRGTNRVVTLSDGTQKELLLMVWDGVVKGEYRNSAGGAKYVDLDARTKSTADGHSYTVWCLSDAGDAEIRRVNAEDAQAAAASSVIV